jgi:hypothetical protein
MQPRAHFAIWYVVGAFVLIIVLQMLLVSPGEEKLSYSRFKGLIQAEQIKEGVIGPTGGHDEREQTLNRAAKILLKREILEGSELRKLLKEKGDKDRAVA